VSKPHIIFDGVVWRFYKAGKPTVHCRYTIRDCSSYWRVFLAHLWDR
jgi:hypothetical protein